MTWLYNSWYQAGWSDEVSKDQPLIRTILGQSILFYRCNNGDVAALFDRCPHRFVPLSAGPICGDVVTCPYHGLAFGPNGDCVVNPHGPITSTMAVRSFPIVERHTAIWVWMGDAKAADPAKIPDLSYIDAVPETARFRMHIPSDTNYQLMIDNIMDLSHADYVHATSIGGMMTDAKVRSREEGDKVVIEWTADNITPAPGFAPMVALDEKADFWTQVAWQAPGVMVLLNSVVPVGAPRNASVQALHNMVPETETSTHYFMCATRSFALEDEAVTAAMRASAEQAFLQEDKPILQKQQQCMGTSDFWSLKPVLLSVDAAGVRVRRKLEALIAAEEGREPLRHENRRLQAVSQT